MSELLWEWHVEGGAMLWYFCDRVGGHIVRKVLVHVMFFYCVKLLSSLGVSNGM